MLFIEFVVPVWSDTRTLEIANKFATNKRLCYLQVSVMNCSGVPVFPLLVGLMGA